MGQLKWYKREPEAALDGMRMLSLEERGAYNTVLDLMYLRAPAPMPDDDVWLAGQMRCTPTVWRRIKKRLLDLKKLTLEGDFLVNGRVRREVVAGEDFRKSAANFGKKSAELKKERAKSGGELPNNNDLAPRDPASTLQGNANDLDRERERTIPPPSTVPGPTRATASDPAGGVVDWFLAERERVWPNESRLPAPTMTIRSQAMDFITAGASAELLIEVVRRSMAAESAKGRRAPSHLGFYRLSIERAISEAKPLIAAGQKPLSESQAADFAKAQKWDRAHDRWVDRGRKGPEPKLEDF